VVRGAAARIAVLAAERLNDVAIAQKLGVSRPTCGR